MKIKILNLGMAMFMSMAIGFAQVTTSGKSSKLSWTYKDGILIISGNAAMSHYNDSIAPTWLYYSHYIKHIIVEEGVSSIGNYAFFNCGNLTSIVFPDGSLTSIGEYAFWGCENLTSIIIPKNVTSIGNFAFNNCKNLKSIEINRGPIQIGSETFYGVDPKQCTLRVPAGSITQYQSKDSWKKFKNIQESKSTSVTVLRGDKYVIVVGSSVTQSEAESDGKKLHDQYGYHYEVVETAPIFGKKRYRIVVDYCNKKEDAVLRVKDWKTKPGIKDATYYSCWW